jgi:glutaconyl-CoA/methylmalonyl-CoA decarboxylase subunit gamma
MKKYKFAINGNPYEVNIVNVTDDIADVVVNGINYQVELDGKATIQQPIRVMPAEIKPTPVVQQPVVEQIPVIEQPQVVEPSPVTSQEATPVICPLPGVILDILVKQGDSVKAGQKLFVLEAMKMENDINSDRDGKIVTIHVQKGDSVMEGDTLVDIG